MLFSYLQLEIAGAFETSYNVMYVEIVGVMFILGGASMMHLKYSRVLTYGVAHTTQVAPGLVRTCIPQHSFNDN